MTYIDYLNDFNRWLEEDNPTDNVIILYYAFLNMFNRRGWPRWAGVDTRRLMSMVRTTSNKTAYRARDALVSAGFIEYRPGKKGKASEYRLLDRNTENDTERNIENDIANDTANDTEPKNDIESDTESDTENDTPNKTKTKTNLLPTITTRMRDEGLGRVMSAFLDKINPTPSQNSIDLLKGFCEEMGAEVCPGQQHLKLAKEDVKEGLGIKGSAKVFFLDAYPLTKVGVFAQSKGGLAQDIQIQRRHILLRSG